MCIVCDIRNAANHNTKQMIDGVEMLGDIAGRMLLIVERLRREGSKLDTGEERDYAMAMHVLQGKPLPASEQPTPDEATTALREAVSAATGIPADRIEVISPEELLERTKAQTKEPTQH